MRKTMPKAEKDYIIRAMPGMDDLLLKVLWEEMSKGNGIQIMDFEVLQAFYDEFEKRPHVLEKTESEIRDMMGKMTESYERRNTMRLTKRQLKRIIREEYSKLISENASYDDQMIQEMFDWIVINEEGGVSLKDKNEAINTLADDLGIDEPTDDRWEYMDFAWDALEDLGIIMNAGKGWHVTMDWAEASAKLRN